MDAGRDSDMDLDLDVNLDHDESDVDGPVAGSVPWLTPRRVTLFTIIWLAAFALGSIAVSNPFATESSAGVAPSYWHVMARRLIVCGPSHLLSRPRPRSRP